MSVSTTVRKVGFNGNGIAVAFPFAFKVFQQTDVLVVLTDNLGNQTTQTLTSQYSVSLNAEQDTSPGGTVTTVTAPPTGYTLTIGSQLAALQSTVLTNTGGFFPTVLNNALDYLTILVQQIISQLSGVIRFPFSDPSGLNATLPTAAQRANTLMAFDASGNVVQGPNIASVGTVTSNIANINAVAADLANLNTDAGAVSAINAVASDLTNINAVAGDLANINIVATDKANIDAVAGDLTNVNNVAGDLTNINIVAADKANIDAVAGDLTNINAVAGDLVAINNAPTEATNAANSATAAANSASAAAMAAAAGAQVFAPEVSIASAATTAIGGASSMNILITGITAITAFDTVPSGIHRNVRFAGALTLTNSAALNLPGGANITTAANDCMEVESLGSGNWIIRCYQPASGLPVIAPQGTPTGSVHMWTTATAPSGYLMCTGAAVSRTTYAALFAVIGVTFGAGDGSTTFNLPNYVDRMPIGAGTIANIAGTGGAKDAVVVSHTHAASVSDPGHSHSLQMTNATGSNTSPMGQGNGAAVVYWGTTSATTGISVSNANTGVSGTNANLPPYLGINFIIKT